MNIGDMMKQAASLQGKMQEMQEKVAAMEVIGKAAGGMIEITMNGKGYASKVHIDPSLIVKEDAEVLEDLICAAMNDAKAKVEETAQKEMSGMTDGMTMPPGFKMPF